MGSYRRPIEVRFPTLEVSALQGQAAFAIHSRPLINDISSSYDECSDAKAVFGDSIDLAKVRVVTSPVISAPTTLGNTIRIPPSYVMPRSVLIHELTHVWQFQTKGTRYISDSVLHQTAAMLTKGDRDVAYKYKIEPNKSFHDYTAEQQAMIIQEYFVKPWLRNDPDYKRILEEVRAARPLSSDPKFYEDMAIGMPPRGLELPKLRGEDQHFTPLIEIRF